MIEQKVRCDSCGAYPALEVRYGFDRVADGNGTDSIYKTIDLCPRHMSEWLNAFLGVRGIVRTVPATSETFSEWASRQKWAPK